MAASAYRPDPVEVELVRSFFRADRVGRLVALLASARGRQRAIERLGHCDGFDERCTTWLSPSQQTVAGVLAVLEDHRAPVTCYVVSEDERLDQTTSALSDAVTKVVGSSIPTLLICDPRRLAYFEGEDLRARAVLLRD